MKTWIRFIHRQNKSPCPQKLFCSLMVWKDGFQKTVTFCMVSSHYGEGGGKNAFLGYKRSWESFLVCDGYVHKPQPGNSPLLQSLVQLSPQNNHFTESDTFCFSSKKQPAAEGLKTSKDEAFVILLRRGGYEGGRGILRLPHCSQSRRVLITIGQFWKLFLNRLFTVKLPFYKIKVNAEV